MSTAPLLPLAPDRTTLLNRINLLLSAHDSKAKSLLCPNGTPSAVPSTPNAHPHEQGHDHDSTLSRGFGTANFGVGYVPQPDDVAAQAKKSTDEKLRRQLLGNRGRAQEDNMTYTQARESDGDDEEAIGRSAVGRSKRAKLAPTPHEIGILNAESPDQVENDKAGENKVIHAEPIIEHSQGVSIHGSYSNTKKNKRKRKNQKNTLSVAQGSHT